MNNDAGLAVPKTSPVDLDPDAFVKRYAEILNELEQLRERRKYAIKAHENLRAKVQALKNMVDDIDGLANDGKMEEALKTFSILLGVIRDMEVWEPVQVSDD